MKNRWLMLCWAGLLGFQIAFAQRSLTSTPTLRLSDLGRIEVVGVDANLLSTLGNGTQEMDASAWKNWLKITTEASQREGLDIPLLGTYQRVDQRIQFTPRFPFARGEAYMVQFQYAEWAAKQGFTVPESNQVLRLSFQIPKLVTPPTNLTAVFPSTNELPANQLKVYLVFSAPMRKGEAYQHIHLIDEAGQEVPRAFLVLEDELWDDTRQHLTIHFDPGRIKRGLRSNIEDGPPFREGNKYILRIDRTWKDGNGNPLSTGYEKKFTVVEADRTRPELQQLKWQSPVQATVQPFTIDFPEPMDYSLLQHTIQILDKAGTPIEGSVTVENNEKRWKFTPSIPWKSGAYSVHIEPTLEDLGANNFYRLFDVDLDEKKPGRIAQPKELEFGFVVKGKPVVKLKK